MTEIVNGIRADDLRLVMELATALDETERVPLNEALARLGEALASAKDAGTRPPGVYGRLELPGYRENEGWITEETRFGLQMAVVRNRAGQVTAEVSLGPACRFVHLPEPAASEPEAGPLALPAGDPWDGERNDPHEEAPF